MEDIIVGPYDNDITKFVSELQSDPDVQDINSRNSRIRVIAVLSRRSASEIQKVVFTCNTHGGVWVQRKDNALKSGCPNCGTKSREQLSDADYLNLYLETRTPKDMKITSRCFVMKRGDDRNNGVVNVRGAHFNLTCPVKNLEGNLNKINDNVQSILLRHGENVAFEIVRESSKTTVTAECKISGLTMVGGYKQLMEWAQRANKQTADRLKKRTKSHEISPDQWLAECFGDSIKRSHPEKKTAMALNNLRLANCEQVWFPDLRGDKRVLRFDFYLSSWGLVIEVDSVIHHQPNSKMGGEEGLRERQLRDKKKEQWAKSNSHKLQFHKIVEADKKSIKEIESEINEVIRKIEAGQNVIATHLESQ